MPSTPLYTYDVLPADDKAAMREFDDRYIASIGAVPPPSWATDFGELITTAAPMVTFPIGSLALKYEEFTGEARFKTLAHKSFDIKASEFAVGIEGFLKDILTQTFAYRNWTKGPERMMLAEARHRNGKVAALLEAGQSTAWVDGVNFFSASHPSDLVNGSSTTWSNYQSSAKNVVSIDNIQAEVTLMQGVLDENGQKLGADPDTILVPTAKYEPLKNLLSQNFMLAGGTSTSVTSAATSNPYVGRFNVVHVPELTDVNDWYLLDSKLLASSGLSPWIMLRQTAPSPLEDLRHWDASSDFFKDTNKVKVASHIWTGHALGFPHTIRKVVGA